MTFSQQQTAAFSSDKDNALSRAELTPAGILINTTTWIYQQQDS